MKGIAIQTILLLLVGILVVGIVIYMVYRYFVGAPLNEQECRARLTNWCSSCKVMDYSQPGYGMTDAMIDCIEDYGFWTSGAWTLGDECNTNIAQSRAFCAQFTP